MANFPGQKPIGEASILIGLSSWAIELLDVWGRWQLLIDLSHVGIFRFLLNPYASPLLIFAGMFLLRLGEQREFQEAVRARETPIIYGVERTPPKRYRPWKLLLLIPAAFIIGSIFIVIRLLTYTPPVPPPVFATIETHDDLLEKEGKVTPKPVTTEAPSKTNQNCPGGICAGRDINGNPTVNNNFAPPARRIAPSQKIEFSACLARNPGSVGIMALSGDPDAYALANDWYETFHNAGWSIDENRVALFEIGSGTFPDTTIHMHGSINADGTEPRYDPNSPEGSAVACIQGKPLPNGGITNFEPSLNVPTAHLGIIVGARSPGK